jgi:hypothetical protein
MMIDIMTKVRTAISLVNYSSRIRYKLDKKLKPNMINIERFQDSAMNIKMADFLNVEPYNTIEVYRRFRGAYCLYRHGDDGGNQLLRKVDHSSAL